MLERITRNIKLLQKAGSRKRVTVIDVSRNSDWVVHKKQLVLGTLDTYLVCNCSECQFGGVMSREDSLRDNHWVRIGPQWRGCGQEILADDQTTDDVLAEIRHFMCLHSVRKLPRRHPIAVLSWRREIVENRRWDGEVCVMVPESP